VIAFLVAAQAGGVTKSAGLAALRAAAEDDVRFSRPARRRCRGEGRPGPPGALSPAGALHRAGAALLSLLSLMFLIFGLLLVWTAVRLYRHRDRDPDIGNNPLVRSSSRILPVGDTYIGGRLIARVHGRRVVTPLFVVFITIRGTDILFELDSIPAVFGVTDQAYIVFAANAFALLGLRALFSW
jgi:tellurite resistance protein TerC